MNFGILGPLEVIEGGRSLPLGGPKQRVLLAMLLLEPNRPVSRDRLIDGIWGASAPAGAPRTLDSHVSRLRRVLGERLRRTEAGYLVHVEPGELDLERFDTLAAKGQFREALEVWRGPALADLVFQPFAAQEAERLEQRRLDVVEERIDSDLATGRGADLVAELDHLVAENPLRERLVGELMVALYRAGRQAAALETYRTARRRLADELGLDPGPHLQELERRVLTHDPTLGSPVRTAPQFVRTRSLVLVAAGLALVAGAVAAGAIFIGDTSHVATASANTSQILGFNGSSRQPTVSSALPSAPSALVAGFGALWAAAPNGDEVLRLDAKTGAVDDRIPVRAQPSTLAIGDGAVWVASAVGGLVTRIDPVTDRPTEHWPLAGANPSALAFSRHALWVADQTDGSLVRIDPDTGNPGQTVTLHLTPTALAAGAGELWAADYDSATVEEVDPESGPVGRVSVGQGPSAIAVAAGSVWVANNIDGTLTRIDATTGERLTTIPIGSGPESLAAADGSVWVANEYSGTLRRVNARTGRAGRPLAVGGSPTAVAAAGSRLWVGAAPSRSQHRGGTLTLGGTTGPNSLDPAVSHTGSWEPSQLTRFLYDGLVTFANDPGPAGLRLVPDLALRLPQSWDGGRTYIFRLRPGIRYSDGRLVRAADFRRGIERLFRIHSPGAKYYRPLVGAAACTRPRQPCDLSQGIETNDAAGTVIFHLAQTDPDFLFTLTTFAFGAPIPPDTPDRELRWRPPPGTGPYRVASATSRRIVFERNPYFHEWSHAAQPQGNPDTIVWRVEKTHAAEIRDVLHSKVDWTLDFIPIPQLRMIRRLDPQLLHANPAFIVEFIPLNTHLRPFDSPKVRQALNYAIDRRKIVRLYGGNFVGTPLCQPLPPKLPGYLRYCPYTERANGRGTYTGPDLARARQLVAASGRSGARVVVWGISGATAVPPAEPRYIVHVLRSLGFKARLHMTNFNSLTAAKRTHLQLTVDGDWPLDYPNPAAFLPPFFSCNGPDNAHYYCNPALDRLMERASLAAPNQPRLATSLWKQANRLITDQAYWVPTINLHEVDLVSPRLHNYEYNPVWGFLADQAWTSR